MPNKNYVNGRSFEYRVKRRLEADGYYVVRSAGSKGKVDLLAVKDGNAAFVQCKRHGAIDKEEANKLYEISLQFGGAPVLAEIPKGKTRGIDFWKLTGLMGRKREKNLEEWDPKLA